MVSHQDGTTLGGGLRRVFHCNYYNSFLQMTVLLSEGMTGCHPQRLLKDAATPLVNYLKTQSGYSTEELIKEFTRSGFGKLRKVDATTWETPHSHYSEALCFEGIPQKNCFFTAGYIQGITEQKVEEVECQVLGNLTDKFVTLKQRAKLASYLIYPARLTHVPPPVIPSTVAEDKIKVAIANLPLYGKEGAHENGLIEAFGVVLTNHFADYYNRISYETYLGMRKFGVPQEDAKELFIQAGLYCAFFTYGGIMESSEWYDVIVPMCKTREDWLHGILAVTNCLGWGSWQIEAIEPPQTLIIRIYNSYEGVGYRRMYPPSADTEISFLAMGGCLGLAHLLWKIDIRDRPQLTWDFYLAHFNDPRTNYQVTQTHAIAAGDEYDRLVVSQRR